MESVRCVVVVLAVACGPARAAAPLLDDGFALVGHGSSPGFFERDAFIETRDLNGDVIWAREYAGSNDLNDEAIGVAIGDDGFVYVLVREGILSIPDNKSPTSDSRLVVLRYTPEGVLGWRWEREHPLVEMFHTYSPEGMVRVMGDRVLVLEWANGEPTNRVELAATGDFVGELQLAPSENNEEAWAIASDGEVARLMFVGDFGSLRIRVERFADDGTVRWSDTFGDPVDRHLTVITGDSGETYVAFAQNPDAEGTIMLRRYESDGGQSWTVPVQSSEGYDSGYTIVGSSAPDETILLTGTRNIGDTQPAWIVRISPDGSVVCDFETDFPPPLGRGHGYAVIGTVGGGAVVLASYEDDDNSSNPWLGAID